MSLKSPLSKCSNVILLVLITLTATNNHSLGAPKELPGTASLSWNGDIASRLIDNCDQFLLKQIEKAVKKRNSSSEIPDREKLKNIIGIRDKRIHKPKLYLSDIENNKSEYSIRLFKVRVFEGVSAEGFLIQPKNFTETTIFISDPESLATTKNPQILAANGHRVFVPILIDRKTRHNKITNREFLYRSAFELGRHIIGYEVQKVLAIVDALGSDELSIGVAGNGEGGLISMYASAIDERIKKAWIIGHFGPRERVWDEPAYRNVFGLLNHFGDAEIARLILPRKLIIDPSKFLNIETPKGTGGKPGKLPSFKSEDIKYEIKRAGLSAGDINDYLEHKVKAHEPMTLPVDQLGDLQQRAFDEIDRYNQRLLTKSAELRRQFLSKMDPSSLEKFEQSMKPYRKYFGEEVIGLFEDNYANPNPRTRLLNETEFFTSYEVVIDVFGGLNDLFAYGILTIPKGIKNGEQRPVVVCQHGLEGRPQSTIGEKEYHYYKAYSTELAKLGFVTFAPQNIYIFQDRFRGLQFKANAIGKTLFSIMVPQHQQITDWLGSLDFTDKNRIAFYGLSYGGKSAMRIPPLVNNYCLSICSADFNEWVWKNASTLSKYSYVWTGEYEIFEWDLGSTFNYFEMAALIAPRPFMVERGHFDGVAPDEKVAHEYAKVRNLYSAKLGIGDKTEIEWFVGPPTINAKGTFKFLRKHLNWPAKK